MTVAAAVALWHRAHLYKALACLVLALIGIQYLLSGIIDRRSIESIFTINASRYTDRTYRHHPRGLIIYGPVTAAAKVLTKSNITTLGGDAATTTLKVALRTASGTSSRTSSTTAASATMGAVGAVGAVGAATATTTTGALTLVQGSGQGRGQKNFSKVESSLPSHNSGHPATIGEESAKTNGTDNSTLTLPRCPLIPPNLVGPVAVSKTPPELSIIEKNLTDVKAGGRGYPKNCISRHRVAIVIPFRDRPQHLQALLYNLHPILLRQQIDYQIFVVEQKGTEAFNRAMLMNVGYVEALKERVFDCFIFHDVDLLPEDDRNLYTCPEQPRHMSVAVDKFKYRLPYADLFGGVSALSREQFKLVNGFSNVFWGWGGEDDDMANRIKAHGLHISRYPANVARYKMLTHKKEKANPKRYEFLKTGKKRFTTDGLSNLRYELVDKQKPKLYTWLLVKITPPQPS